MVFGNSLFLESRNPKLLCHFVKRFCSTQNFTLVFIHIFYITKRELIQLCLYHACFSETKRKKQKIQESCQKVKTKVNNVHLFIQRNEKILCKTALLTTMKSKIYFLLS